MSAENENTFQKTWNVSWEVERTIPGAKSHVVLNSNRFFKSGRRIVEVVFFNQDRQEVARRDGMRLVSRKGNEYVVCRREDNVRDTNHCDAGDLAELLDA